MKNLKVPFTNDNNGYPMYFQTKKLGDNIIFDIAHNGAVTIGDTFQTRDNPQMPIYEILDVSGTREPGKTGKNHHPKGVMWHQITCKEIVYNHKLHQA